MSADSGDGVEGAVNTGRFKRGMSGNPRGRPSKRKHGSSLSAAVDKARQEKVKVTEAGRQKTMSRLQIGAAQLANKAASGDLRALRLMSQLETAGEAGLDAPPERLREDDIAVVARLVARIRGDLGSGGKP